jgi:hypothetical protein
VTEERDDRTRETHQDEPSDGERPPRAAMLILVLFPFALIVIFGLLYAWIRR